MQEGKLGKGLKQFLTEQVIEKGKGKDAMVCVDPKLCAFIFLITCFSRAYAFLLIQPVQ